MFRATTLWATILWGSTLWLSLTLFSLRASAAQQSEEDGVRGTNPQTCESGESPDIIVADVNAVARWGNVGGITAYSLGLQHCNPGTCWLNFFHNTNQHPVLGHNMYRLKTVDGAARFEQIGMSWLMHGFFALSNNFCFADCDPTNGQHLGVHCADVSSASMQGQQNNLGPRSQVDPHLGDFPVPFTAPPHTTAIDKRLQVHDADLDPALNVGALYFAESQYVTPDDALSGNGNNNASHRRIIVGPAPYNLVLAGATRRELGAIRAWKENGLGVGVPDPAVEETDIDVPGDGRFILAARATDLGNGLWRYEYALQNLNSHRAAMSFTVPLPGGTAVSNTGFHDVDYHSGEPYDLADWTPESGPAAVTWSTDSFEENENANALRWGTLYNFRFDSGMAPGTRTVAIGLFRPGDPDSVMGETVAPVGAPSAMVSSAVSRKLNPAVRAACDLSLFPVRASEPRSGGVSEVRVGFNVPPGSPNGTGIVLEEATCAAPAFVPYSGASEIDGHVEDSELVLTFRPGLENARTYRMTLTAEVTAMSGQSVEVRGLVGDVTGDGGVNAGDRSLVVGVWTGPGFSCASDLNNDGATNAGDRSAVVGAWTGLQNCAP